MRSAVLALAVVFLCAAPAAARSGHLVEPAELILTEDDIADRTYQVLGDVRVLVRKQTLFGAEPTREKVDQKLRKAAAKLGADAIILVRYGTIGMGVVGWGELEGRGRAIRFD